MRGRLVACKNSDCGAERCRSRQSLLEEIKVLKERNDELEKRLISEDKLEP